MRIEFTKLEASGNDFIIVDNRGNRITGKGADLSALAKDSCRRKYSVGADGLLALEDSKAADFRMRIFNPDGSEAAMCGNGIRCAALYAQAKKWCASPMRIETGAGVLEAAVVADSVRIKMTPPKNIIPSRKIGIGKTIMDIYSIDTGVPHAVHFVENLEDYPVKDTGRSLRFHKAFEPEGTNVDFVEVREKSTIAVRTYERGVEDETLACGTGVVASAIISHLVKAVAEPVNAATKGGDVLKVYFKKARGQFSDVHLEGKARIAFEGGLDYV